MPPPVLFENPATFLLLLISTPRWYCGAIIDEGGVTYIIFGTERSGKPLAKIALPESKGRKPEVLAYIGKKVIFGIRPNDIYNDPDFIAKHPEGVVDCALDLTELLGAESNIYLKLGDLDFTAVVDTRITTPLNAGDTVRVCFDTSAIHLFDYETEKTITN